MMSLLIPPPILDKKLLPIDLVPSDEHIHESSTSSTETNHAIFIFFFFFFGGIVD